MQSLYKTWLNIAKINTDTSIVGADNNINYSIKDSKSFDYEASITGKLEGKNTEKEDDEIAVPLKYLGNDWRTLDLLLINCEVSLTLTWSVNCVITNREHRKANVQTEVVRVNNPTTPTVKITNTKLYVLLVILSTESDNKLLE